MKITRLRVTGGFLSGIDFVFSDGLNVLIGGRGTGKSTVLELIRFALGLDFADQRRATSQQQYVADVLGNGEIVVDFEHNGGSDRVVVNARGEGRRHDVQGLAVMVSQNETEAIASDADSRLRLIDLRAGASPEEIDPGSVEALTVQLADLQLQIDDFSEQLTRLPEVELERDEARGREMALLESSGTATKDRSDQLRALEKISADVVKTRTQLQLLLQRSEAAVSLANQALALSREVSDSKSALPIELLPSVETLITAALEAHGALTTSSDEVQASASLKITELEARDRDSRVSAEPIRTELMASEAELARVTLEVGTLNREVDRLRGIGDNLAALRTSQEQVRAVRSGLLTARDEARERIFAARLDVADAVNKHLADRVTIALDHYGDTREFRAFLTAHLRKKGLQYASLIDGVLSNYLPRTFLEVVENRKVDSLAEALSISSERSEKLIDALSDQSSLAALVSVEAADQVDYRLRDGHELKSVEQLSTGQKCAVTLPILLTDFARTLILDQPEDHLDNAYLVRNVVSAFKERTKEGAQTIVASHNANIPVLGNAGMVLVLESDGTRGYVREAGDVDQLGVVASITEIMEGGAAAFAQRANFYAGHGVDFS